MTPQDLLAMLFGNPTATTDQQQQPDQRTTFAQQLGELLKQFQMRPTGRAGRGPGANALNSMFGNNPSGGGNRDGGPKWGGGNPGWASRGGGYRGDTTSGGSLYG